MQKYIFGIHGIIRLLIPHTLYFRDLLKTVKKCLKKHSSPFFNFENQDLTSGWYVENQKWQVANRNDM